MANSERGRTETLARVWRPLGLNMSAGATSHKEAIGRCHFATRLLHTVHGLHASKRCITWSRPCTHVANYMFCSLTQICTLHGSSYALS
jgi:hypothetical protein